MKLSLILKVLNNYNIYNLICVLKDQFKGCKSGISDTILDLATLSQITLLNVPRGAIFSTPTAHLDFLRSAICSSPAIFKIQGLSLCIYICPFLILVYMPLWRLCYCIKGICLAGDDIEQCTCPSDFCLSRTAGLEICRSLCVYVIHLLWVLLMLCYCMCGCEKNKKNVIHLFIL